MTREQLIQEVKKYFSITELVCPHTYEKFKETSWQFLNEKLLHTLLILRTEIFKAPMTINNGQFTQRGLRCNICSLCKDKTTKNQIYLSAHVLGLAVDFDVKGFTAQQARDKIALEASKMPFNVRLEADVNWVHIDLYETSEKVKIFKA